MAARTKLKPVHSSEGPRGSTQRWWPTRAITADETLVGHRHELSGVRNSTVSEPERGNRRLLAQDKIDGRDAMFGEACCAESVRMRTARRVRGRRGRRLATVSCRGEVVERTGFAHMYETDSRYRSRVWVRGHDKICRASAMLPQAAACNIGLLLLPHRPALVRQITEPVLGATHRLLSADCTV